MLVVAGLCVGGGLIFYALSNRGKMTKTEASVTGAERKFFRELAPNFDDYKDVFQQYPRTFQDLIDLEWIREIPLDMHSRQITYKPLNDGKSYELRSAGKDGVFGNDDDSCLRSVSNNKVNLYFYSCADAKK